MIAVQPEDPTQEPDPSLRVKNAPSEVRLLQMDIAVKDKRSQATGWIWGTFMYDATSGKTVRTLNFDHCFFDLMSDPSRDLMA